jgi:Phage derived protein Gp49-like (DUF891)
LPWQIEYFEKVTGEQPAEAFEDGLDGSTDRDERRIGGKLLRFAGLLAEHGPATGGGYVEPCHEAPGIWQLKADAGRRRGREFFAFDDQRVVLLHGAIKGGRQPTPAGDYRLAMDYLDEYKRTRRVSPEADDE